RRSRSFSKRCSTLLATGTGCSHPVPVFFSRPAAARLHDNHAGRPCNSSGDIGESRTPRSPGSHRMSNIAGKAYAMNAITPMRWYTAWLNRFFFWGSGRFTSFLGGLLTLSLIHYPRWVILKPNQFPRLSPDQPEEQLKYHYMFFFSNFNGSWDQYVDSFSSAISGGLDNFCV